MSVEDNMAYGVPHLASAERHALIASTAERFGIGQLLQRKPGAISGGERGSGGDYLDTVRRLGAAKVLLKPFPTAVLLAAIDELLPGDG